MNFISKTFLLTIFFTIVGCDGSQSFDNGGNENDYNYNIELQLEDARDEISSLQSQIDDLEGSVSDLEFRVKEFQYNDWADIVPNLISEVEYVRFHLDYVESSADDLEYTLE